MYTLGVALPPNGSFASTGPAGVLVESADGLVGRRADENQSGRRHHRTAVVLGAGQCNAPLRQLGVFAERHFPLDLAGIQIDRVERAPRRFDRRIALAIEHPPESCKGIGRGILSAPPASAGITNGASPTAAAATSSGLIGGLGLLDAEEMIEDGPALTFRQVLPERRHTAGAAFLDNHVRVLARLARDVHQRREARRRLALFLESVTRGALVR